MSPESVMNPETVLDPASAGIPGGAKAPANVAAPAGVASAAASGTETGETARRDRTGTSAGPSPELAPESLARCAKDAGLDVLAEAAWPEHDADVAVPTLAGFVVSSFSPLAAEVANRCLSRRGSEADQGSASQNSAEYPTAVVIVTARGDLQSARHVAEAVDAGARIGPLMFFQSVPNAVAGHIAARWKLSGPVLCLGDPAGASEAAALLLADGDADEVLLVHVEQDPDRAAAVLVRPGAAPDLPHHPETDRQTTDIPAGGHAAPRPGEGGRP